MASGGHFGFSQKKHVPLLGNFGTFYRSLRMTIETTLYYFFPSLPLKMPKIPGLLVIFTHLKLWVAVNEINRTLGHVCAHIC